MNFRFGQLTIIAAGLVLTIFFFCSLGMAISAKVYLNRLAAKADYVILCTVKERRLIFREDRNLSGNIIPTVGSEGTISVIKVNEILFTRDPAWKEKRQVYIYQKGISIDSAILIPNKSYILFLREDSIDMVFVKKYNLPRDNYFFVLDGHQGQVDSSDSVYLEAVREFCSLRKMKDEKARSDQLQKLSQHSNLILRGAAEMELKQNYLSRPRRQ